MKLSIISVNQREQYEKYSATINRTYIIDYMDKNISKVGHILQPEARDFYTFISNKDFELLYSEGINIQLKLIEKGRIFYAKVGFLNRMKLYFFHKRLWIQKEENIRWLLNMIIVTIATYAAFKHR